MSPICLGCTLLQSLEAQLGGRRCPFGIELRVARGPVAPEAAGPALGLLPTTGPLIPGLSPVVTSVPLHQPQSQGSLWALTPPSLHLHTSCDGVLTASQAARPDTQSWGCQERELISKC